MFHKPVAQPPGRQTNHFSRCRCQVRLRGDDRRRPGRQGLLEAPKYVAQYPLDSSPDDRTTHASSHCQADRSRRDGLGIEESNEWMFSEADAGALSLRFRPPGHVRSLDTVSRCLPFARRRLKTLRPSAVLMRFRKPCVRTRLLLFG